MDPREAKVYIAAPFFTPEQIEMVSGIEEIMEKFSIDYFSPRKDGTLKEMDDATKEQRASEIYKKNIEGLHWANIVIALIDDYDAGTIFEIGYFTALRDADKTSSRKIITTTNKNYGINIMLRDSVAAHAVGLGALHSLFKLCDYNLEIGESELSTYRNFGGGLT